MTDGPHTEPLQVTKADGLCLPEDYIGHDGGLVVRVPTGLTVDGKPREWGGHHGAIGPCHFGSVNDDGTNAHLAADEVSLKRYGHPAETFRVDVEVADAE